MNKKPTYEDLEKRIQELEHGKLGCKQIEDDLRKSESRYRQLVENLNDVIYTVGKDGRISYVSPSVIAVLGYTPEELVGEKFINFIHPADRDTVLRDFSSALQGKISPFEYRFRTKSGDFIWVRTSSRPIIEKNQVVGMNGVLRDISDRKQAEKDLQESQTKFRLMMEAMKDPIYICSPDFLVEYMNPAMIKRVGHDDTGEYCFKSLHGLDEKCTWCQHDMIQQGMCSEFEIVSPKDNRSYLLSQTPVVNENGSISKMTVYKDMTELRAAETRFLKAQKMEAIGTLAGGIAHDFNNILSALMGFAQLAFDEAKEGSVLKDDIQEILKASNRAKDLVGQILAFARQEEGAQAIPMRVSTIVREAVKLIKASIPASVTIKDNVFSHSIVVADPSQIHQIVMNLCTNAAQAMDDTGLLTISLEDVTLDDALVRDIHEISPGAYLQLTIADTGKGIPPELLDRIFEPYFTTKKIGEGTGLGLSTVHGIVKSCGGGIKVESKQGKGSVFKIYFPVVQADSAIKAHEPIDIPSGMEKILFVDDELPIIKMAGKMLERLGYTVTKRSSSLEALELFKSNIDRFDLVITDMTMPSMTGDRLAEEIMKIRPDIPVILCTGYSRKISRSQAEKIGIKAFILKPLIKNDLAKTIRQVLDKV